MTTRRYIRHENISFKNSGTVIKYNTRFEFDLDASQNQADFNETFWAINIYCFAIVGAAKDLFVRKLPFQGISKPVFMGILDVILDSVNEKPVHKETPRMLLEGRKIPLIDILIPLASRFGLDFIVPKHFLRGVPESKFGFVRYQNSTREPVEMWSGVGETKEKFARVLRWRGQKQVSVWSGKECNKITGTNGEFYRPETMGKPLKIFLGLVCRSIDLDLVKNEFVSLSYGLKAYEYQLSPAMYQGTRTRPQNKC